MSMLRADLNAFWKFVIHASVIDRYDIAAPQIRGEAVDPIECRLIENPILGRRLGSPARSSFAQRCGRGRRSLRKRALDEHKLVVLKIDKFFHPAADQAYRQCV